MKSWCKIIEVLDNQVLFYMEPDSTEQEEPCESLHQIARIEGVCGDIKITGIRLEHVQSVFDSINEESAINVVKTIEDFLENQQDELRKNNKNA